jgi:ABC-type multidrug transport system fused ATPase/permease subunit
MKRLVIASLVGTIILYIYLALVHTLLPIHKGDYRYTSAQDSILQVLKTGITEDGMYFLPNTPPGAESGEEEKRMEEMTGKPWALVMYHSAFDFSSIAFLMSFIYNLLTVIIICIALAAASNKLISFGQRLWFVMLFPLFVIFGNIMLMYNWESFPMHYLSGQIGDVIVGYFFVGLWLAWYYARLEKNPAL